jgi:hypothetical protein
MKKAAEAAETVVMRYSGDTATLSSIVISVEQGIMKVLDFIGMWLGIENVESEVHLNRDFVSQKLSAQDITALISAYQANTISLDTFLYNMSVGEVLPADTTIEQEKSKIKSAAADFAKKQTDMGNFLADSTIATADSTAVVVKKPTAKVVVAQGGK